jgi:hypothetical protein
MSSTDWIIGKGINGEYYCPSIDELDTRGYRTVVETGFLQIILKGGFGSLVLLLLILIPALFRGIAKGRNILSKASGIWILLWILFLYPTVGNTFAMNHILVWIAVGICFSPKILRMTDMEVYEAMQPPKRASSRKTVRRIIPQEA